MPISRFRPKKALKLSFLLLAASASLLPSCEWDGNFTVLGYTTKPQYPTNIHTVYVPIFKNLTLWRRLEFDLTRAVIREIESKTPYKVVSNPDCADTELKGTIVSLNKNVINRNQRFARRKRPWRWKSPGKICVRVRFYLGLDLRD